MKFTLLRAKNLTEKTDYATLQHMHELFFFLLKHRQFTEHNKNRI